MRLLVDTRNGLAGDIMAAGLIGLGAPSDRITNAMEAAGNLIDRTEVSHSFKAGIHRLGVDFASPGHLHASEAKRILGRALIKNSVPAPWDETALRVLDVMTEAEGHVHSTHHLLKQHYHGHEPVLHEASDIIIDIAGMAVGMSELGITSVEYLDFVNVGSGCVKFSHGNLDVPTPATRHILDHYGIAWKTSDSGMESTTPTGASILAGCGAVRLPAEPSYSRKALAGGTRPLPPVAFILY